MAEQRSHTGMFQPSRFHGEQMDGADDAYYIALRNDTSGISGYVTRAEFNWLAERLGFAPLPDEPVMPMLPNDQHPGPRCSCRECLEKFK